MRRALAMLALLPAMLAADDGERLPTDEARLNAFARAYNEYVERLKGGVIDARLWREVMVSWRRLL